MPFFLVNVLILYFNTFLNYKVSLILHLFDNYTNMRATSSQLQDRAISLLQNGVSIRDVASECKLSRSCVQRLSKKHPSSQKVKKTGRPKKLSPTNVHYCAHQMTKGGQDSSVGVQKALKRDHDIQVSRQTVSRALNSVGLGSTEKESKPLISAANAKKRLAWCRAHRDWTKADWKRVIFTDEAKINRFDSDGRKWAWIRDKESVKPKHVKPTVKHGDGGIML